MDEYFEYSQIGHMKHLSLRKVTEFCSRGDVDGGLVGRSFLKLREMR
jgi:hypothetical protein